MKRKIIKIDEDKCTGCGNCIPDCPEGALQIIDGKARLVSDLFCDGLGACVGACPEGAMTVEERDAEPYDERKVMENIVKQGPNTIKAHLRHLKEHGETEYLNQAMEFLREKVGHVPDFEEQQSGCAGGGCPGSKSVNLREEKSESPPDVQPQNIKLKSELRQWPVQLKLINPNASYFDDADLLIAADCAPFAFASFHQRFIKDKITINLCPKLDSDIQQYIDKLAEIFTKHPINSITIVRMEVPCCGGTTKIVEEALKKSGKNIIVKEYTISINGEII
jgi:ferredoxin